MKIALPPKHYCRNSTEHVQLENAPELGELQKLTVSHDNSGTGADWFLEHVEIREAETGSLWKFPCRRWVDSERESSALSLDLFPVNEAHKPQLRGLAVNGRMTMASGMVPHPSKTNGGEDACFFHSFDDNSTVLGVADGVGDWALRGVDAGEFARRLLLEAHNAAALMGSANCDGPPSAAARVLQCAWDAMIDPTTKEVVVPGSSTVCIVSLDTATGELGVANLGDSGVLVCREGHVEFRTPQQEHFFGFPFQLSSLDSGDKPEDAQVR
mmetsp:Transcript_40900/g.95559  ORF Transcript_40900/g.95559 Transcript_40900/m.95559 type:complete len:270 (-) Transcript_40900:8-817(-)